MNDTNRNVLILVIVTSEDMLRSEMIMEKLKHSFTFKSSHFLVISAVEKSLSRENCNNSITKAEFLVQDE